MTSPPSLINYKLIISSTWTLITKDLLQSQIQIYRTSNTDKYQCLVFRNTNMPQTFEFWFFFLERFSKPTFSSRIKKNKKKN